MIQAWKNSLIFWPGAFIPADSADYPVHRTRRGLQINGFWGVPKFLF